jgi:hypothetical protein
MRRPSLYPTLLFLALAACSDATAPNPVGNWGGMQASLLLTRSGGTLSYPCSAGTVDSGWAFTRAGKFTATGKHFFGGGPVPPEGHPPRPALYSGRVTDSQFTLTVTLTDLQEVLGPFVLVRGGPQVQEQCD